MALSNEPSPRYKLKTLAKQLHASSSISLKLARWVANAIDSFLSGESGSLDAAFGLKKPAPRGWPLQRARIAKAAYEMRGRGMSFHAISKELKKRGFKDTDRATIKRCLNEFKKRFMAREVANSLKSK